MAENVPVSQSCLIDISASTTVSLGVNLGTRTLCGLKMPAAWTAATLTVNGHPTDPTVANHGELNNSGGTALVLTVAANELIYLDPNVFRAVRYVSLVASVAQAADRSILLISKQLDPAAYVNS